MAVIIGIPQSLLTDPALQISVANNARFHVAGAGLLTVTVTGGQTTQPMVYFAEAVGQFYLIQGACMELGIISKEFPAQGLLVS